jgi:hypothetical protein
MIVNGIWNGLPCARYAVSELDSGKMSETKASPIGNSGTRSKWQKWQLSSGKLYARYISGLSASYFLVYYATRRSLRHSTVGSFTSSPIFKRNILPNLSSSPARLASSIFPVFATLPSEVI